MIRVSSAAREESGGCLKSPGLVGEKPGLVGPGENMLPPGDHVMVSCSGEKEPEPGDIAMKAAPQNTDISHSAGIPESWSL